MNAIARARVYPVDRFRQATLVFTSIAAEAEMRSLLLAATAAFVLSAGVVQAEPSSTGDAGKCVEWPAALVAAQMQNPDASLVKVMDGSVAKAFIKIVNQLPPVSSFDGNHVALFFNKNADQFLVVIGQEACARDVVQLPAAIFAAMVGEEA